MENIRRSPTFVAIMIFALIFIISSALGLITLIW
jgi:hypothetical protein